MRPYETSEKTRRLLAEISNAPRGFIERWFGPGNAYSVNLIDQIKEADELESVIGLSQFLHRPPGAVKPVVDAIVALLDQRVPLQLARLDDQCRRYSNFSHAVWSWARLPRRVLNSHHNPLLHGLISMHPNGHVREAAIMRLKKSKHNLVLTFLLIRSNDWVKTIRKLAIVEIIHRASSKNFDIFVRNIALIESCSAKTRGDFSIARTAIDNLLVKHADRIKDYLIDGDVQFRRAAHKLSSQFNADTRQNFIRLELKDKDPLIRSM